MTKTQMISVSQHMETALQEYFFRKKGENTMANNQIINKLNKKARPDGFFNFKMLIRAAGSKDYKNSQLCTGDGVYQTPWVLEKVRCLAEYDNKVYCQVDKALEPVAHTIASKCKELELLVKPYQIPEGIDQENRERLGAKMTETGKRRDDIMIQLSELMMDIETIDAALQHHLQRAENVIIKHVFLYWNGVLKAAASGDMPPQPSFKISDIPGKAIYENHLAGIRECLEKVLADTEHAEEV